MTCWTVPLSVPRFQVRRVRLAPLADDVAQPVLLALLGAEGLDHGVAADRIGQRAAERVSQALARLAAGATQSDREQTVTPI